VFAACRRDADGEELQHAAGSGRLIPIILDVTHVDQIERAVQHIDEATGGAGLDGLVNNAGIGQSVPVELTTPEDLRRIFEVNLFGQLAVIRAFLPLVRRVRGRIVNVGSVGAKIAIPFGGPLCSSKAAFEMFSDSLRLELRSQGILVSIIQPGAVRTPAVEKTLGGVEQTIETWPDEMRRRYGAMFRTFNARALARETRASEPEVVARAIHHALTSARPRIRYRAGRDSTLLTTLPRLLPDRVLDLLRLKLLGLPTKAG
jgi:NAD(P)-dependent dehydrogenase (short-subunit alcohol dehydrogenase family)